MSDKHILLSDFMLHHWLSASTAKHTSNVDKMKTNDIAREEITNKCSGMLFSLAFNK